MKQKRRNRTFQSILNDSQRDAGVAAWERACRASALRRLTSGKSRSATARQLAKIKRDSIRAAITLVPDEIVTTIDDDYQIGLLSVRWPGRGRLHLPADTRLPETTRANAVSLAG
jgi:hypothetical protein